MENNDINEISGETPEESVAEFTADDNSLSFKIIDSKEKHVKYETEVLDNYIFYSIVEIPRATDQSTVLLNLGDNEYPPDSFFLNNKRRYNTFNCSVCDAKFKLKLDLDQHVEKNHNNNIEVPVQNILNPDDAQYDNNCIGARNSKHLEDEKSNCTSKNETYIAKHVKVHSLSSSYKEEYLKGLGLVTVSVQKSLLENLGKSSMLCRRCRNKFERNDLFQRHIKLCRKHQYEKNNVNDNKFVCPVCECHFSNAMLLRNHIISSRGHWICQYCEMVFNQSDLWSKHMDFCIKHNSGLNETCVSGITNIQDTIDSTPINDSNVTERKLHSHSNVTTIKEEPIDLDLINELNIKLEPQGNAIPTGFNDDVPETNHFEGEQCHSMNESQQNERIERFNNIPKTCNAVVKEEPTEHASVRMPHKCQLCFRAFKTRGNLTNHMKGFQCPIKKEQLSTNDVKPKILVNTKATNLQTKKNELAAHNTVQVPKPFMCNICYRSFTSSKGVKIHLKSHYWNKNSYQRDQKPNKNDTQNHGYYICGKKFFEINALQAHIKAQHFPVGYTCEDCGKRFPTNFGLGVHIINTHK